MRIPKTRETRRNGRRSTPPFSPLLALLGGAESIDVTMNNKAMYLDYKLMAVIMAISEKTYVINEHDSSIDAKTKTDILNLYEKLKTNTTEEQQAYTETIWKKLVKNVSKSINIYFKEKPITS